MEDNEIIWESRVIKFRTFIEEQIGIDEPWMYYSDDWRWFNFVLSPIWWNYVWVWPWFEREVKTSPRMQYTWLKDKNGEDIYEWDILQYRPNWNYGVVVFADWCFKINWQQADHKKQTFIVEWYHEIVGNVYENPELLK